MCLGLRLSVILPNRKQVSVHCAHAGHSASVAAVPVIPLSHQPHHQILQLCQLHLSNRRDTTGRTQTPLVGFI